MLAILPGLIACLDFLNCVFCGSVCDQNIEYHFDSSLLKDTLSCLLSQYETQHFFHAGMVNTAGALFCEENIHNLIVTIII